MKNTKLGLLFLSIFIALIDNKISAQNKDTINVGIVAYPYFFGLKNNNGTLAIGPSISLGFEKLTFQLSIMEDIHKYNTYTTNRFDSKEEKNTNFYLSTFFNYNYVKYSKLSPFIVGGFILGGQYYKNDRNYTGKTNGINFMVGTGCSYKIFNYLKLRTSIGLRYSSKIIFPGMFVDMTVPIKITH